jgi:putative ABC transport system permease protein
LPGGAQAWLPINAYATMSAAAPDIFAIDFVGRLRANATATQAAAEFDAFLQRPDPAHMSLERRIVKFLRPSVTPLADVVIGSVRPTIIAVTAAALLLLIVTCVSAANLLMVRALSRERELAVRVTLGAGRWRIARQLVAESGLIAAASVIVGLSLAFTLLRLFARFAPENLPRFDGRTIHLPVLLAIALCCAIVTIGVSLAPVITRVGRDVGDALRGRATGERLASARSRRILVISQVAVSVCALVGAGLFLRSFIALGQVNLGFQPAHVIFARIAPSPSNVKSVERLDATIDEVVGRPAPRPRVVGATPGMYRPITAARRGDVAG